MLSVAIKSKVTTLKIFGTKVWRLLKRLLTILQTNPTALPGKLQRKTKGILLKRLDLGFLFPGQVRIAGNFYPVSDLLASSDGPASSDRGNTSAITVIIPVYRNLEITRRCIDSVLESNLPKSAKVLILNDCSPDVGMKELLDSYSSHSRVMVSHNSENLGFVRNVNNGMNIAGDNDVVLLNSDTVVAGDWLQALHAHSICKENVSSVTATSNNATICSFPVMEGVASWPLGCSTKATYEVLRRHNRGRSVEIPTAVGFCMYITRRSLNELGAFDEAAFGKGYGEENDFCLRGIKRGWRHLQALDVGVYHEGEVSFGASSNPGKERAAKIIRSRYPDYDDKVAAFAGVDPARAMRAGGLLAMLAEGEKSVELVCTHIHGGGVARAVSEFVQRRSSDTNFLILQRASQKGFYQVKSLIAGVDVTLEFSALHSPEVFRSILKIAKISRLQVHHVMDYDLTMLGLLRDAHLPFDFYLHDYWTVCPQVTLTTAEGVYCGEPDADVCNVCIAGRGERTHAPLAKGLPTNITQWRATYKWLFESAESITAPSRDVIHRMQAYYPTSKFQLHYHEPQDKLRSQPVKIRPISTSEPMKIAIIGSIGVHKGLHRISDLEGAIKSQNVSISLKIIGDTDPLLKVVHPVKASGPYQEDELARILETEGVHAIWFPEGAPETYSYTLSHAMRLGYPVVAPRIGAFPERLEGRDYSILTDRGLDADGLIRCFLSMRESILTASRRHAGSS